MSNTKELDKVLTVNEQDYNINAVHSDAAAKVDHPLTIKESTDAGYAQKDFDGSTAIAITYVPASGGKFTGNITTPEHKTSMSISDDSVLNKAEISTLVGKLTGASCYTWDYNKDTGEGDLTVKTDETTNEIQNIGIVVGDDDHAALSNFALTNSTKKWLPFYLYITYRFKTDNMMHDDARGNIYIGTADSTTMVQLTNQLAYSDSHDAPWTAEDLDKLETLLFGIGSDGGIGSYKDNSFLDRIKTLEGTLNTHNTLLTTTVQAELSYILNHLDEQAKDAFNQDNQTADALIKVIRALRDYTNNLYTKLIDGSIWVQNAANATNASTAVSANSATSATSATKASQDEQGRNISTNYYRTGNKGYKDVENTITVSGNKPTDKGNNGDIWILI